MPTFLLYTLLYINGQSVNSTQAFDILTSEILKPVGTCTSASSQNCQDTISAAHDAFKGWSQTNISTRIRIFTKAAELLEGGDWKDRIITSITEETGASLDVAMFKYATAAKILQYTITTQIIGRTSPLTRSPSIDVHTDKHLLGLITQSPWNAPVALTLRAITMPILCGNTVVFRPFELSPQFVYEILEEAGSPDEVFNSLSIRKEAAPPLTPTLEFGKSRSPGSDRVGKIRSYRCSL
ncbi:hypothetical protein PQX77_005675 [Marasmius sp. AFHP31]|nr:hypothetical protein PQX77_005675 [Marasmius sp. AFHP31]